jgi:hypothetical protein
MDAACEAVPFVQSFSEPVQPDLNPANAEPHLSYSRTGNGLIAVAGARDQTGMAKSGMGSEVKNFRVYRDNHRAPEFAFFRRALSVLIPVPAYILR